MKTLMVAVIATAVLTVVAIVGLIVVRKTVKSKLLRHHHGVSEAMLGVVGTLFSVLLGFMVAGAMDRYHDARQVAENEANDLADIFRLAKGLSNPHRIRIRNLCRKYAIVMLEKEWKLMEKAEISPEAYETYIDLWEAAESVKPNDDRESNIHQQLIQSMTEMGESRRARVVASQAQVPWALWAVVICGAGITIGFTYFFATQWAFMHVVMTSLVAVSLGLNIWLLAVYSYPFSGELGIQPRMFELLRYKAFPQPDDPPKYLEEPLK